MLFCLIVVLLSLTLLKIYTKMVIKMCKCKTCLCGKTAIVTGGNSGIGYQTALALASRGCRVIIADKDDSTRSREMIIKETRNTKIVSKHLDLASLESVESFARDIISTESRLDILINNAGTTGIGDGITKDGLLREMQINHFSPFLLTHLLVDLLKKSAPSRIIFVASIAAFISNLDLDVLNNSKFVWSALCPGKYTYHNTKIANMITSYVLAEKLKSFGVTSNCLHPGAVKTNIFSNKGITHPVRKVIAAIIYFFVKLFGKSPEEGAQTSIHLALSQKLDNVTGEFFINCRTFVQPYQMSSKKLRNDIYEASCEFVKLAPHERL